MLHGRPKPMSTTCPGSTTLTRLRNASNTGAGCRRPGATSPEHISDQTKPTRWTRAVSPPRCRSGISLLVIRSSPTRAGCQRFSQRRPSGPQHLPGPRGPLRPGNCFQSTAPQLTLAHSTGLSPHHPERENADCILLGAVAFAPQWSRWSASPPPSRIHTIRTNPRPESRRATPARRSPGAAGF